MTGNARGLGDDRILPLAFSLNNNPRCYVAVVGAGLSTASQIPMAGMIVDDLIAQVAATRGAQPDDLWAWYEAEFGVPPTYQGLLGALGPSTGDRQGILRKHFARTPNDEPPTRQPNDGHLGLARLSRLGLVRTFITTNFDMLIEEALQQQGLNPTTIASEEDFRAAPPIDTLEAVVIHIHGVWHQPDTLRNTEEELGGYPDWVQRLLGRSFEGRGYVIVGWSGKYDPALREALTQNKTSRYSAYWLDLAEPSEAGRELLVDLGGIFVEGDAGDILTRTSNTIEILRSHTSAVTNNAGVQVARIKKAIGNKTQPTEGLERLGELVDHILNLPAIATRKFDGGNDEAAARRVEILNACREAAAIVMTLAMKADPEDLREVLAHITRLGRPPANADGSAVLQAQQQMPGLTLLAAAGVGAAASERWALTNQLLTDLHVREHMTSQERPLAVATDVSSALSGRTTFSEAHPQFGHAMTLLNAYLAHINSETSCMPASTFDDAWDQFETLWHIACFADDSRPAGIPHLKVQGHSRNYLPETADWAKRLAVSAATDLPFLSDTQALNQFFDWFAEYANRTAWSTLPAGRAGFLPGSGWRLDERGSTRVPDWERETWWLFGAGEPPDLERVIDIPEGS